jgi:Domain of unknown function (DUF4440)
MKTHTAIRLTLLVALLEVPAAVSTLASGGATEQQGADLRQLFQKVEQSLMDAVATGDKAAWAGVMDDTCVITTEEGTVLSRQELLQNLNPLPGIGGQHQGHQSDRPRAPTIRDRQVRLDERETVFGQALATKYQVTDTFRQSGGAWKMVASHASVVTSDPSAQAVSGRLWGAIAGRYQLLPGGWVFHVLLRDGRLYGGRDPSRLRH